MTSDRKKLLAVAGLLFAAGSAIGARGLWIARNGAYEDSTSFGHRTYTQEVKGPEAVLWGWTLTAGGAATLAWAAMLTFPPLPSPRFYHFGLVGLAFLAIASICVLRMWPPDVPSDARARAFYASWAFMAAAAGILAWLQERAMVPVGVALAAGVGAALYAWGFKGLEGMILSLGAAMLLGLHAAAYIKMARGYWEPA